MPLTITVRAVGRRTVEFCAGAADHALRQAISDLATPSMRAPRGRAVLVRQDAADDLMALLEARNFRLEIQL